MVRLLAMASSLGWISTDMSASRKQPFQRPQLSISAQITHPLPLNADFPVSGPFIAPLAMSGA